MATVISHQEQQIAQAVAELVKTGKQVNDASIVAGLNFSFWTAMFGKEYETLWQQLLHRIADSAAPNGLKRKSFTGPLTRIRILRNRIAHHEPILGWDLGRHHACILQIMEWLSSPAAEWCRENDRFGATFPIEGIQLNQAPLIRSSASIEPSAA